ncbi:MAG: SDR family NAD(P)-dependent oxidoreductase [Candidatus Limnocylindrales bacterium]
MTVAGKVVLITGASTGIGEACSRLFAREGARVILLARHSGHGETVAASIRAVGGDARFYPVDVSRSADIEATVGEIIRDYGRIDILFNNAGTMDVKGTVLDVDESAWDLAIASNLKSVFLCSRAVIPHMIRVGGGVIVNNASISALIGSPAAAAYSASKAGVVGLTRNLAVDFAPSAIRVNCICPGAILTPTNLAGIQAAADPGAVLQSLVASHPIGRLGSAEEVAQVVLFLSGEGSSFMTGAVIPVDGGYTTV